MSKKLVKGDEKPAVKLNGQDLVAQKERKEKIFIGVAVILAVIMIAYIVWENHHTKYLVEIDGEKYTLENMMYDVAEIEGIYDYMAEFYAQLGYTNYWNMELEEGLTVRDEAREKCMDTFIEESILYKEAAEAGYAVNDEDKKEAQNVYESYVNEEDTEESEEILGYTKDEFITLLEQKAMATRYKEDLKEAYNITEDDVKADVDKEAYRQYDIEYFSISIEETDAEDTVTPVSDEEKEIRYAKLEAVLEQAGSGDWSKVIEEESEEEETDEETDAVTYDSDGFIEDESNFDEETTQIIMAMENGEVSDIMEIDGSYYVIRMINNNSAERYESEIKDAISELEETRFEEDYSAIKEKHQIEIYEKEWKRVQLGEITV